MIDKHPHVIQSPNVSDSIFVKFNGTYVKNHNHPLQISLQDLHNYLILPVYRTGYFGSINEYCKVCIVDTSLQKSAKRYKANDQQ